MNPDYYWAIVPAVGAVLLNAPDAVRLCLAVLERVFRAGVLWK